MKEIRVNELVSKLAQGEQFQIVDIRETQDHSDWHIPGSLNCPAYDAIGSGKTELLEKFSTSLSKEKPVVAVCRGGMRSQTAVHVWQAHGLNALNLVGGMRAWSLAHTVAEIPNPGKEIDAALQIRRNGKGCLSYLLISDGKALVIDPSLPAEVYEATAKNKGAKISHVIETHIHADHVSRGRELAKLSGAQYLLPQNTRVSFSYTPITSGQVIPFGKTKIKALATPGHTAESTCYLIGQNLIFTGDTFFTDNVGRPDLEKGDTGAEAGARQLYNSLTQTLFKLPDETRIFAAHTSVAIGFDGTPIFATINELKIRLKSISANESEFVSQLVARLTAKPGNFDSVIGINEGKIDLDGEDPANLEAGPNRCAAC